MLKYFSENEIVVLGLVMALVFLVVPQMNPVLFGLFLAGGAALWSVRN